MRNFVSLLLIFNFPTSFAFFSSAISYKDTQKKVEEMLMENKPKEAQAFIARLVNSSDDWCLAEGKSGSCRKKVSNLPDKLKHKLAEPILCHESMSQCSKSENLNKGQIGKCIIELKKHCNIKTAWDKGSEEHKPSILFKRLQSLKKSVIASLNTPLKKKISLCNKREWAFSYLVKGKSKKSTTAYSAAYKNRKLCEVAKYKARKRGVNILNSCKKLYLGEDQKAQVYALPIMYDMSNASMKTAPVHAKAYFDSKAGCEKAIRSGFQFQWSDTSKIKIHPKASDNINSVTDNCSNETVLVCSANTDHLSVPFIH